MRKSNIKIWSKDWKLLIHIKFSTNKRWQLTNVRIFLQDELPLDLWICYVLLKNYFGIKFPLYRIVLFQKHEKCRCWYIFWFYATVGVHTKCLLNTFDDAIKSPFMWILMPSQNVNDQNCVAILYKIVQWTPKLIWHICKVYLSIKFWYPI